MGIWSLSLASASNAGSAPTPPTSDTSLPFNLATLSQTKFAGTSPEEAVPGMDLVGLDDPTGLIRASVWLYILVHRWVSTARGVDRVRNG
jgi:hypothetical protein